MLLWYVWQVGDRRKGYAFAWRLGRCCLVLLPNKYPVEAKWKMLVVPCFDDGLSGIQHTGSPMACVLVQ